jgi:hypothetical protein
VREHYLVKVNALPALRTSGRLQSQTQEELPPSLRFALITLVRVLREGASQGRAYAIGVDGISVEKKFKQEL